MSSFFHDLIFLNCLKIGVITVGFLFLTNKEKVSDNNKTTSSKVLTNK